MAKKGGNKKARRVAEQAAAEALVRFGPELSGLTELQRSAQSTYKGDIRNATQTALGIAGAARAALPQIQRTYEKAGGQLTNTWNQVDQDIAGTGGQPNSAIEQAIIAENAASRSRLREARVHSKADLTNRIVNAQEGRATAVRAARSTLASELGKVQRRRADVLREKGAFTQATLSGLLQAETDRATRIAIQKMSASQQERNSLRSAGIDPDTGTAIPGGRLDPDANAKPGDQTPPKPRGGGSGGGSGGSRWVPPASQSKAADIAGTARQWAERLKSAEGTLTREEITQVLSAGREAKTVPIYDPVTGKKVINPDGTAKTKKVSAIPKITSPLLLQAAIDVAFDGYLSKRTQRQLHARGYKIKALGLPSAGSRPPRGTGSNFAPGPNGQIRPN